jgi:hypothetical protein
MTATQLDTHPGGRQRAIGPLGTTARVLIGGLLLASVTWGHLTRGFRPSAWLLGLLGFPALLVAGQWLRARRTPAPLQATGPLAHALNVAVFVVLYLLEPTSDAACSFMGPRCGWRRCAATPAVRSWPCPTGCCAAMTRSAAHCSGRSTSWSITAPRGGHRLRLVPDRSSDTRR